MDFFHSSIINLFFWLCVGHALADYALQSDFMAMAKNSNTELGRVFWPHVLTAHSLIHAGFVMLFTGVLVLALLEFAVHFITDWAKCQNKITLRQDQCIHYGAKLLWIVLFSLKLFEQGT